MPFVLGISMHLKYVALKLVPSRLNEKATRDSLMAMGPKSNEIVTCGRILFSLHSGPLEDFIN